MTPEIPKKNHIHTCMHVRAGGHPPTPPSLNELSKPEEVILISIFAEGGYNGTSLNFLVTHIKETIPQSSLI